jgi:transketolase
MSNELASPHAKLPLLGVPKSVANFSLEIRRIIIEQSWRAGVGHIGSALSVADIINCLYFHVLNLPTVNHPDRDRFVLSKGHAALALYAAFYLKGWITRETLETYCADGSLLGVHPEHCLPGIDFSTGSLGQGLPFATGSALAALRQGSSRRVFVLMSDAECNEGSVWESVMFSAHHKLANLYVVIDLNGQQALGYTKDVLDMRPLDEKWRSFGWETAIVDGHSIDEMQQCIAGMACQKSRPHVLIARTIFGKGVSFMESQIKWHYSPLSNAEYERALRELAEAGT